MTFPRPTAAVAFLIAFVTSGTQHSGGQQLLLDNPLRVLDHEQDSRMDAQVDRSLDLSMLASEFGFNSTEFGRGLKINNVIFNSTSHEFL